MSDIVTRSTAMALELTALRAEVEQYDRSFDLRWAADMRAIKRWQAAHPGNDMNWPDHGDLVVWLLERDAALRAENERLRQVLENTQHARVLQGKAITDACNEIDRLRAALRGVIRVADRKTVEFDEARAALEGKP